MRAHVGCTWLLLTVSLLAPPFPHVAAQVPAETLPRPSPLEAPPPRLLPGGERPGGERPGGERPGGEQPPSADGKAPKNELALPTCSLAELKENFLKLKAERAALQSERLAAGPDPVQSPALSEDSARLRLRLGEILTRLGTGGPRLPAAVPPLSADRGKSSGREPSRTGAEPAKPALQATPKSPEDRQPGTALSGLGRPLDPLALAQALFKAANYEASLRTYKLIDVRGMRADERLPIQYMIATCWKRLGKNEEAAALYREIANSRGDEELALCAQWQLSALRWQQEMQGQLANIRERRAALESRR